MPDSCILVNPCTHSLPVLLFFKTLSNQKFQTLKKNDVNYFDLLKIVLIGFFNILSQSKVFCKMGFNFNNNSNKTFCSGKWGKIYTHHFNFNPFNNRHFYYELWTLLRFVWYTIVFHLYCRLEILPDGTHFIFCDHFYSTVDTFLTPKQWLQVKSNSVRVTKEALRVYYFKQN